MFEDDSDRFHQLVEEALVGLVELAERGELDHRLDLVLEQSGEDVDVGRGSMAEARADPDEIGRNVLEEDRPSIRGRLADETLAEVKLVL